MGYYINKNVQPDSGDYEVHQETGCSHPADPANRIPLGTFLNCQEAVAKAKQKFPNQASNINGCYYCCNLCHTT